MATRTRTIRTAAVSAMFLAAVLSEPQVWAQTDPTATALERMAKSLADMAESQKRESEQSQELMSILLPAMREAATRQGRTAQAPATTALTHTAPASQVGPDSYLTREEWNVFLAGDFANLKKRVGKVESLVGRIAPRQEAAAPAPRQHTSPSPAIAQAKGNGGLTRVKVTPPALEEFLSVAFTGDVPSQKDLAGIKNLLGQYELVQVIALPTPGKDDQERAVRKAARGVALNVAYGTPVTTRPPANDVEAAQLVNGAPKDAGAVFHLRLKGASVATALPTP